MRFFNMSLAVYFALASQALASPAPQSSVTPVYHCGGTEGLSCPPGWRCCGPIQVTVGGTCFKGLTGVCPL